ncbi:MAG: diacylglycerol kinase family protein [Candidatus Nealsonbacteria bacterium]
MIFFTYFKNLLNSFKFAFSGMKLIIKEEYAFRVMLLAAVLVIVGMFYFNLPVMQKAVLFIMIFLVLILELINSVVEEVLDFIHPGFNGKVKIIKDMLAGMVLLASLGAAIIGLLIFLPYF